MEIRIRKIEDSDKLWIKKFFIENWGSDFIISRGKIHKSEKLDGFITEKTGNKIGLITFNISGDEMEIVSMNSIEQGKGIGTLLLEKAIELAKERKLRRVWLITTNDNLNALGFYQKRGFFLAKIYPNALDESRKIKPEIPKIGENGIPLRDEIELEIIIS